MDGGELLPSPAPPRTIGRASKPSRVDFVRDLTPQDVESLQVERGIRPPAIKRIRDSHHAVAKALALDNRPGDVAALTGYSQARISILLADPAFQELMEFYRGRKTAEFLEEKATLDQAMMDVALDYTSLLQERIDYDPEGITNGHALKVVETMADRLGYGPSTKSTNVNINVNAERLRSARERLQAFDVEGPKAKALPTPSEQSSSEGNSEAGPGTSAPPLLAEDGQ